MRWLRRGKERRLIFKCTSRPFSVGVDWTWYCMHPTTGKKEIGVEVPHPFPS